MEGLSLCAAVYGIFRPWTNVYRFRRQSLWQDILQTCRVTTARPFAAAQSVMGMPVQPWGGRMLGPHRSSPCVFPVDVIKFCLAIKVLFKVLLWRTNGTVTSFLSLANSDWAVPNYPIRCQCQKTSGRANSLLARRRAAEPPSGHYRDRVSSRW